MNLATRLVNAALIVALCVAVLGGCATCMVLGQGGNLIYFKEVPELARVDGEPMRLSGTYNRYTLYTMGGRHRLEYRFKGGKTRRVDLFPSLLEDEPILVIHRGSIEGSIKYRWFDGP